MDSRKCAKITLGSQTRGANNNLLRRADDGDYFNPSCGCSSVVEHLLAKEDVASSSLVTRSSARNQLIILRMARTSFAIFANSSSVSACAPSESASDGLQCTSIIRPSAPTATPARASGATM